MTGVLVRRAEAIGRSAARRRLHQIAAELRSQGVEVTERVGEVSARGRGLMRRWISDPALRFIGRRGQ